MRDGSEGNLNAMGSIPELLFAACMLKYLDYSFH